MTDLLPSYWLSIVPFADLILIMNGGGNTPNAVALFNGASRAHQTVLLLMIVLYSYPELFGVADNNGYGLKVFAFMRLAGLPFTHEHIFDASAAPRGQLPYIIDDGAAIGDSENIIAHLTSKYRLDHRCRTNYAAAR